MQEFFLKHKKHIISAGIALLVVITVAASGVKLNATLLESAIGVVVTPFQDLTTGISSWIDETVTSARNKTDLKEENEKLKNQIAELMEENRRLAMYEEENAQLSSLLKIAQRYPDYESVGAKIIAKDPGVWYDGFTIDKGTSSDISANMVLIAPEGLVGKVLESGATFSKAQSILDSRSSVPAMSVRTGDLGVVKGDYSLSNDGLCKMEYIDGNAEIMVGDEIVTSHLSDIYPEGLAIGKVLEIETDTNGLTKYAVIEPYVDLKHLDTILVIDKSSAPAAKTITPAADTAEAGNETEDTDMTEENTTGTEVAE
ncbi:rod shape-determining protein MreC [Anaerotignum sp.]|nr:rod shape-determining protein MreC [Anaerotignum sp.]MBQ7758758.1 rod shape-determining protein MreC [Anaerotignum sp.]